MTPNAIKSSADIVGSVYTASLVADWVAAKLFRYLPHDTSVVLDPACGDGELLYAVSKVRRAKLYGWDINPSAIDKARQRLGAEATFEIADSLFPLQYGRLVPDAVISNPPWGSPRKRSSLARRTSGLELAVGQYDLFELFIERLVKAYHENCIMAFIVPDSIFLPEHERLRRFLLSSTHLLEVARLGEGFFPGIFRGSVVLLVRTGASEPDAQVKCSSLNAGNRHAVLTGQAPLSDLIEATSHWVPQERFLRNRRAELDLDVRLTDTTVATMLRKPQIDWHRWFNIGRGVEIGKGGHAIRCPNCGRYRPVPNQATETVTCAGCRQRLVIAAYDKVTIVRQKVCGTTTDWRPLIVGEDVKRYGCLPSREIQADANGIRYNGSHTSEKQRLLIRKTGIGLHAAIDDTEALTVQTVYHFVPKPDAPTFVLNYLAGILNSRVMLAFYLKRSGESQWRSHPYVTPKTIMSLPIPDPFVDQATNDQAQAIAEAVRRFCVAGNTDSFQLDLAIECLVAGLFDLRIEDCDWVASVLRHAQPLRAITTLRLPDDARISPIKMEAC